MPHAPVNRSTNTYGGGRLFERSAFQYDNENDRYRCPGGAFLARKQTDTAQQRTSYAARASDCAACALKPQCTTSARR